MFTKRTAVCQGLPVYCLLVGECHQVTGSNPTQGIAYLASLVTIFFALTGTIPIEKLWDFLNTPVGTRQSDKNCLIPVGNVY